MTCNVKELCISFFALLQLVDTRTAFEADVNGASKTTGIFRSKGEFCLQSCKFVLMRIRVMCITFGYYNIFSFIMFFIFTIFVANSSSKKAKSFRKQ